MLLTASRSATEVWVKAPALSTTPSKFASSAAACKRSMSTPSWLLCKWSMSSTPS